MYKIDDRVVLISRRIFSDQVINMLTESCELRTQHSNINGELEKNFNT